MIKVVTINQGDIFWIHENSASEKRSVHPHPYVVIQDNLLNHSRITTVVACLISTNLKKATEPGNVLLNEKEGNLPKQSIIIVSGLETLNKSELTDYVGTVSKKRIKQIFDGIKFLQLSYFDRN